MSYIYRVKYKKNGPLRFISHLDLNALFIRTLRRTKMPVELSQGYNPRFKVSFGPALPLGIPGWQEVLDFYLMEELKPEYIKKKINMAAPVGLSITEVGRVVEPYIALSQSLCRAVYQIILGLNQNQDKDNIRELVKKMNLHIKKFLDAKQVLVEKQTKKGVKEINLRPYIHNLELLSCQDEQLFIRLMIDIQYKGSVNPCLVINEFLKQLNDQRICIRKIIREQLILDTDGNNPKNSKRD